MRTYKYEKVKEYIKSQEHTLLSTEYKNNKQELLIQCDRCGKIFPMIGHVWAVSMLGREYVIFAALTIQ